MQSPMSRENTPGRGMLYVKVSPNRIARSHSVLRRVCRHQDRCSGKFSHPLFCFDDLLGAGKDITHLLEGLGKDHGLGQLFRRMRKLAWGMAAFKTLGLILPYIMATSLWQKAQHFVASVIARYLPYGSKLVSYAGI